MEAGFTVAGVIPDKDSRHREVERGVEELRVAQIGPVGLHCNFMAETGVEACYGGIAKRCYPIAAGYARIIGQDPEISV